MPGVFMSTSAMSQSSRDGLQRLVGPGDDPGPTVLGVKPLAQGVAHSLIIIHNENLALGCHCL